MPQLIIDPAKLRQFGDGTGVTFCLVTNSGIVDDVEVVRSGSYDGYRVVIFGDDGRDFGDVLRDDVPERAHVLVMSPERFFESPDDELIGPGRKLLAMACNSTPTDFPTLRHFIRCIERTDPDAQEAFSQRFFALAEKGEVLRYLDAEHGTEAVLRLFDRELVWNQQAGLLDWGEQQIVPAGEISVLPIDITDFDESLTLPLDGEIVIRGYPILHSGTPSFSRNDQQRIHEQLWPLTRAALRARVVDGTIVDVVPTSDDARRAADILDAMFNVDSRYRKVWEIGHALNTTHELLPGNHAMNEVYGGTQGCLHWGIGLTPFTQYHLDIVSPGTVVTNEHGDAMLGIPGQRAPERLAAALVG